MQTYPPVTELKSIGEKRAEALHALGIYSLLDLIRYYPRDYLDRSEITPFDALLPGQMAAVEGRVATAVQAARFGQRTISKFYVEQNTDTGRQRLEIIFFNQPYLKTTFTVGKSFLFCGRITERNGHNAMESPDYEALTGGETLSAGRIVPVYPAIGGFSQKMFRALVREALDKLQHHLPDLLPPQICHQHTLCSAEFATFNIHFPESDDAYFKARRRLVFEELFIMQLSLLMYKGQISDSGGIAFPLLDLSPLLNALPFELTTAQQRVLNELLDDLTCHRCINRLIQGDVGSGKTALAMAVAYLAAQNGCQTAIMAPTETLAVQHFHSFKELFKPLGISCELLSGSLKKREKDSIKERLRKGEINIILGTHALIQDNVEFARLGLCITDEQHRFGVRQRATLSSKGAAPHTLIMSATPIPRTLALILYGDMDVSILDELPPGRQPIDTFSVPPSYHQRVYGFIRREVEAGHQAYIICPLVQENEKSDLKAVVEYSTTLREEIFPDLRVDFLHGRMKQADKNAIMESFAAGETDILVSTTVIEVGINVPNATLMLIENAERFGLAQLHQLRGRVGRGSGKSYCILVTDSKSKVTRERMKAMTSTNDGFRLSELDLNLRGPGEFFGTMQHGLPSLRLANLYKDISILKEAQRAATQFFEHMYDYSSVDCSDLLSHVKIIVKNAENLPL